MLTLLEGFVAEWYIVSFSIAVLAVSLISLSSIVVAGLFTRQAPLKHTILVSALICCLATPVLTVALRGFGVSTLTFQMAQETVAQKSEASNVDPDATVTKWIGTLFESVGEGSTEDQLPHTFQRVSNSILPGQAIDAAAQPLQERDAAGHGRALRHLITFRKCISASIVAWLLCSSILLARLLWTTIQMFRIRCNATPFRMDGLRTILSEVSRRLGHVRVPAILASTQIRIPCVTGLLVRTVIVPPDLADNLAQQQLCDVLTHECAHAVRFDPIILYLQAIAWCLYWPIPFIYVLNRRISRAREAICDNYVINHQDPVCYAETLVQIATTNRQPFWPSVAVGILRSRGELESRIAGLIDSRRSIVTRAHPFAVFLSGVLFVAATIALCGTTFRSLQAQQQVDANAELTTTDSETNADDAKALRIRVAWGIGGNPLGEEFKRQVKLFNQGQHEVFVEIQPLVGYDGVFSVINDPNNVNELPDVGIVEIHSVVALAANERIQSLESLIKEDQDFRPKDLLPGILTNLRYHDEIVALPFNRSTPILYYNKDRFVEAGLDPERPPETWQEVQEFSRLLKTKNPKQYGFLAVNFPWTFESMVWSAGGQLVDGKRAVFAKPGAKTLQIWSDMVHREQTAKFGEHFTERTEFISGDAAMVVESTALLKWCNDAAHFKVGAAVLPRYEGFANAVPTGGGAAVIPKQISKERTRAAWRFLTWLTDTEQTAQWSRATGYIPVRKSGEALLQKQGFYDKHPAFRTAIDEMKFARETPPVAQWTSAWPTIQYAMSVILRDDAPVLETLEKAEQDVDQLLDEKHD